MKAEGTSSIILEWQRFEENGEIQIAVTERVFGDVKHVHVLFPDLEGGAFIVSGGTKEEENEKGRWKSTRAFKQRHWKERRLRARDGTLESLNLKDLCAGMGELESKERSLEMKFRKCVAEELNDPAGWCSCGQEDGRRWSVEEGGARVLSANAFR